MSTRLIHGIYVTCSSPKRGSVFHEINSLSDTNRSIPANKAVERCSDQQTHIRICIISKKKVLIKEIPFATKRSEDLLQRIHGKTPVTWTCLKILKVARALEVTENELERDSLYRHVLYPHSIPESNVYHILTSCPCSLHPTYRRNVHFFF